MATLARDAYPPRASRLRLSPLAWANTLLAALVAGVGVAAYLESGATPAASSAVRTASVARGVVLSTVSATGNVASPLALDVGFGTAGQVAAVAVTPGEHVAAGQLLGRLDDTSARVAVEQAQAGLAAAQAQLRQTLAGETPAQRRQDSVSTVQARTQVSTAVAAVAAQRQANALDAQTLTAAPKQARVQLRTDQGNLRGAVAKLQADQAQLATDQAAADAAKSAVAADQAQLAQDQANQQRVALGLLNAQQQLAADKAASASASTVADDQGSVDSWQSEQQQVAYQVSQDQARLASDQSTSSTASGALTTDQATVKSDQSTIVSLEKSVVADRDAIANAQRSLATGLAKDAQALATAQRQVTAARQSLAATLAGNAVKQSPAPAGTVAQQRAAIVQAQATLDGAERTLALTVLRAPAAGVVSAVDGVVGQAVSGGGSSPVSASSSSSAAGGSGGGGSSSGFVTLTGLRGLEVVAGFSETDAAKLRVGQPATVTLSALPGTSLPAHVLAIDTTATVVSNVVTYEVTFALDRPAPGVKPGMTADVEAVVGERDGVVHVPTAAVHGSGAGAYVTVLRGGRQVDVPVVTGLQGDTSTEIVSGLSAGETAVLPTVSLAATGTGATGGNGFGGRGFGGGGGLFRAGLGG